MCQWLPRFDCLVIGPGLGRDPLTGVVVKKARDPGCSGGVGRCGPARPRFTASSLQVLMRAREQGIPLVIDADGLGLVNQDPSLVRGYRKAVLTPNKVEFGRLVQALGLDEGNAATLGEVARRLDGPVVVQKARFGTVPAKWQGDAAAGSRARLDSPP